MAGLFLTSFTITEQTDKRKIWTPLNNQLWMDIDGSISLTPKYENFDGFTIPEALHLIAGTNFEWDTRVCRQHDFNCKYHKNIKVKLTLRELKQMGYLHDDYLDTKPLIVCENIPIQYLEITDISFKETNEKFRRMLKAVKTVPDWRISMMTKAVYLNLNWFLVQPKKFDENNLYLPEE